MNTTIPRASAILCAARTLAAKLLLAVPIDRAALSEAMTESAGGNDAAGAWQQRDSFEALEVALSLAIPELVGRMDVGAAISTLEALAKELPTHTVRSEDQIQFQQFSTPPALARLAVHLARHSSDDVVLEPSAGTGIIASLAKGAVKDLILNELEPSRADLLEAVFPGTKVYRHDGAKLSALLSGTERPSVAVMNPPFSVSQSRGEDQNTAARHLRAALDHLLPGGRIVAIMPDWFSPSARYEETFRRTLEGARVVLSLRLDKGGYAKHGTGIAVRVLVIDKVPGEIGVSTINRGSVGELFAALPTVPPRAPLRDPTPSAAPRPKLSLFRSVKTGPARPVIVRAAQTNDVRPVAYEVLDEPAAMGEQRGVYADYRPSRIVIAEAGEHPTHLVESAAMASIAAPKPSYVPSLPERTVTARLLSAAQLETVIYAGEAWSRDLHGRFSHPAGEVALTRAFPTRQMEEYKDELGDVRSRPMWDEAGNPVHNPQAEAARADLIEHICAMPPIPTALDALLEHYGVTAVAEVTGRSKRLVRDGSGQQRLESRSPRTNLAETTAFMTGAKRILVFSDAGGTGRSYHASLDARNQQRRVHFLLEPGWRADRAIQGLGRTHRTHQACPPLFRPVTTDCKGEARFTSTIARRLDALGALTRGQRQTGGQGMFDASDNLESIYAKHALHDWYGLLATAKLKSTTLSEFQRMSGLELTDQDGILREDLPPIQRWLNRILAMKIAVQNAIFDEFLTLVETRVSAAKEAGTFDIGVETVAVEACEVLSDTVIRTDPVTGATSHLLELSLTQRRKVLSLERVLKLASYEEQPLFLRNDKSGKVALGIAAPSHMDEEGHMIRRYELVRPLRSEYLRADRLDESAWAPVTKSRFSALWEEEYAADESQLVTETVYLATGLLLPIWGALPKEDLTVNRIVDKSGSSWLGRHVHDLYVDATLDKLGVARKAQTDPAKIAAAVLGGGTWKVAHPLNFTIRTSRVNGSRRIEIVDAEAARIPELKAKGCFTEIIAYKTRVFVPVDGASEILSRIIA